jgi:hypothetical protein
MKKIFSLALLGSLLFSCGSVKTPSGEVDVFIPCQGKEFQSDKNYFRAFGSSMSNNPSGAMQDAEAIAAAQLALTIERKIKVVSERYSSNMVEGMKGEFTSNAEQIVRQVAQVTIGKTKIACSKTTRDKATGMYKYYTTIELSVDDVVRDYTSLIDEKTKSTIRINRDEFRTIFDQEMEKN